MTSTDIEVRRLHTRLDVLIQYLATVKPTKDSQPILGPLQMQAFVEDTNRLLASRGLPQLPEGSPYAIDPVLGKLE